MTLVEQEVEVQAPPVLEQPATSRLAWYLNRARSMPPQELPHRLREWGLRRSGRRLELRAPAGACRQPTGLAEIVRAWGSRPGVAGFWEEQAEALAAGEVEVLGFRCATDEDGLPLWRRDPVTGGTWPTGYCFAIDYRHRGDLGDAKLVWELSRLQYLVTAAAHADRTRDEALAGLCARHVRSWIDANPPYDGIVWSSGIELSARLVSLLAVAELLEGLLQLDLAPTVHAHAVWLRRFPSLHSSANNHRIAELVGLLVAAAAFPAVVPAAEASSVWRALEEEAARQIAVDGVSLEQSPTYGAAVLEWFLAAGAAGRSLGLEWSPEADARIAALACWLASVTDCAGNLVRIADDDQSRLLGAALPDGEFPTAVIESVTGAPVSAAQAEGLRTFAAGGCSVGRDDAGGPEVLTVLDHGPLGFGGIAAHAHADTLALYLHLDGRPVLVDAGTYVFHGGDGWRDALRSTRVHNTLTVAGRDSSRMVSAFNWHPRERAAGRLLRSESDGSRWLVQAEHDGYARHLGAVHRRTLEHVGAGMYRLVDELVAPAPLPVQWSLLVHPRIEVESTDAGWLLRDGGAAVLRVSVPATARASILRGSVDPVGGWHSPALGRLQPATQLVLEAELGGDRVLETELEVVA